MRKRFGFRRNTHDRLGNFREDMREDSMQTHVWQHTGIGHYMSSRKVMTFDDICRSVAGDRTNIRHGGQEGPLDDRSPAPSTEEVASQLVWMIEWDLVEVCEMEEGAE